MVIFFLFSFFFFLFSFFFFYLSLLFLNHNSFIFEVISPFLFFDFGFSFCFDYVSCFFFFTVSLISGVVFMYSKFYMGDDFFFNSDNFRFFYLLFLFVVSMFFLVFSSSWVIVMLGWDGLGLVSFLLVIFYNNSSSLNSGLLTVFTNRLGDCFFILGFSFMFYSFWFSFDYLIYSFSSFFLFITFLGAFTKSAQVPFSSWLPAAMAAPTPVSSLVHSSTLVTAGVFLLLRYNFLLNDIYWVVSFFSLFTMLLAGVSASVELDFKKVVAMSTLSQLGFMIYCISCGYGIFCLLHMIFHAFFKSCLFLSTGNLMHLLSGDQDSRNFGCLGTSYFSKLYFSLSVLSLMGFPFSLGFYSKDTILGVFSMNFSSFFSLLFFFGCCFTVSYSFRLIYMAFFNFSSFSLSVLFFEDFYFFFPLVIIYFFTVFFGNFFFYNFLFSVVFSFLDFFFGIFIIVLGTFIFLFYLDLYFFVSVFMSISFLSFLTSSYFSGKSFFMGFLNDYSWGEFLGGEGAFKMMKTLKLYAFRLYSSHFSLLVIIFFMIFLVVMH